MIKVENDHLHSYSMLCTICLLLFGAKHFTSSSFVFCDPPHHFYKFGLIIIPQLQIVTSVNITIYVYITNKAFKKHVLYVIRTWSVYLL